MFLKTSRWALVAALLACGGGEKKAGPPDIPFEALSEIVFPELPQSPDKVLSEGPTDTFDFDNTPPDIPGDVQPLIYGALIITEIMYDPSWVPDKTGEYFELYNTTDHPIDLRGCLIQSQDKKHVITAGEPILVPPKGTTLLAASGDPALNGGISPAYVYSSINLANTADELSITCEGTLLDKVVYNTSAGWPKKAGAAMVLDPSGYDADLNDDPRYWCRGFKKFGLGDLGSPGEPNEPCGQTSCGDKFVQAWEECDDGNSKPNDGCEPTCKASPDSDGDGVFDSADNCPLVPNPGQEDSDGDKVGDACDFADCGNGVTEEGEECDDKNKVPGDGCENDCTLSRDSDGDGIYDSVDNCPQVSNPGQEDGDGDKIGDLCDPPECGNKYIEAGEECDDGNLQSGDGCSASCRQENYATGSIIINEFMYDPKATDDSKGEYVELFNTTDGPIDIAGWVLDDGASEVVKILPSSGLLVVPPHGFVVLGRSDDEFLNGGVPVDYAYGSKFSLAEKVDRIRLLWNGIVIDQVEYAIGTTFPEANGRSLSLDPSKADSSQNDLGSSWCPTPDNFPLPLGDFGTPGAPNPPCP